MAVQTIELSIDNHDVKITQFCGVRGIRLQTRLIKLLAPVLGGLVGELGKNPSLKALLESNMDLSKAFTALSDTLEEGVFFQLMLDLLSSTMVDNKTINQSVFDDLFAANYALAYRLAVEVVKANHFFDFSGIGSLKQSDQAATTEK